MEFIDGVTLVSEEKISIFMGFPLEILSLVVGVIISVVITQIANKYILNEVGSINKITATLMVLPFVIGVVIGFMLLGQTEDIQTGRYYVKVSPEVNTEEFEEKYEILDYSNGIYFIENKPIHELQETTDETRES